MTYLYTVQYNLFMTEEGSANPEFSEERTKNLYNSSREQLYGYTSLNSIRTYSSNTEPNTNPEDTDKLREGVQRLVENKLTFLNLKRQQASKGGHSLRDTLRQKDRPESPFDYDASINDCKAAIQTLKGKRGNNDALMRILNEEADIAAREAEDLHQQRVSSIPSGGFLGLGRKNSGHMQTESERYKNHLNHIGAILDASKNLSSSSVEQ